MTPRILGGACYSQIGDCALKFARPIDGIYMSGLLTHELRAFHATARHGSMSEAARRLGLTQPTISAHIAQLEARFRVELFLRQGRRLQLTEFGQSLQEIADRMFEAEAEAFSLLTMAWDNVTGHLRVSAVGPYHVTPLLKAFHDRWPKVRLTVDLGDSSHIARQVLDYHADVGIVVHAVDNPRLLNLPIGTQPLLVFAARGHRLAGRAGLTLADLRGEAFVIREVGSTTRRTFEDTMARAGVEFDIALEMGSREAVHEAVAQGLGLGVVGRSAYVDDPRVVPLVLSDFNACTHPHVICLRARAQARLVRHFLEVVEASTPSSAVSRAQTGRR